jgi:hypothetical protein
MPVRATRRADRPLVRRGRRRPVSEEEHVLHTRWPALLPVPGLLSPAGLLHMQRLAGNYAIQHLLPVQRGPNGKTKTHVPVYERHGLPHPFMELRAWKVSLIQGRVQDLFLTEAGLPGHVQQIQQELTRLTEEIDNGNFLRAGTLDEALKAQDDIRRALINAGKAATFDYKCVFKLAGEKTLTLRKQNGRYTGDD